MFVTFCYNSHVGERDWSNDTPQREFHPPWLSPGVGGVCWVSRGISSQAQGEMGFLKPKWLDVVFLIHTVSSYYIMTKETMMIYDDIWWYMMIYDDIWWYMMIYDDIWWYMMIYDDIWWYMMIYDDIWWYMMIYDDIWWYMMIYDDMGIQREKRQCIHIMFIQRRYGISVPWVMRFSKDRFLRAWKQRWDLFNQLRWTYDQWAPLGILSWLVARITRDYSIWRWNHYS